MRSPGQPVWWLLRLSIRFGMNYGLLSPSRQQIPEFASQLAIESEKKQRTEDHPKVDIYEPSPNHKQAINYALVAFDYDLRCCVSRN